jgi:hypothetical protein
VRPILGKGDLAPWASSLLLTTLPSARSSAHPVIAHASAASVDVAKNLFAFAPHRNPLPRGERETNGVSATAKLTEGRVGCNRSAIACPASSSIAHDAQGWTGSPVDGRRQMRWSGLPEHAAGYAALTLPIRTSHIRKGVIGKGRRAALTQHATGYAAPTCPRCAVDPPLDCGRRIIHARPNLPQLAGKGVEGGLHCRTHRYSSPGRGRSWCPNGPLRRPRVNATATPRRNAAASERERFDIF